MPQTVEIDGVEQTVYSEDEVKPLQTASEEAVKHKESLDKLGKELELGEGETLEGKIKEMKESANPNWKEARRVMGSMKAALKEKGVEITETGEVKSNKSGLSQEEIQKMIDSKIAEGIGSATLKINKDGALGSYSAEDRSKLEPVLDKLMSLGGSLEENLGLAEAKVFPGRAGNNTRRVYNSAVGGGAPLSGGQKENFADNEEGKNLGNLMGLSSFQKKANK
jgi:hypothetical protein